MIRQCALRWAAVLTLVATASMAPLPARFSAPATSAFAQDASAVDAGEPADLAIAALHCAEAPATEALTSFFTTGAAPSGCSPAAGVTISVSEDGAPISGSPAATDEGGIVVLPVSLGSAVEVREDPASLPDGYAPLTQEANGVPYANPVQIDSAVAGAAVLFVNVPRAAATELAQEVPAGEVGEPTDLAVLALQCAAAPETETLTSFFSTGMPPSGCAPAVGVRVAILENEQPHAGSPFTTGADGALSVPISLGAVVSVMEDLASLPAGYEPLTHAANGVPYANPVKLDAATADSAVLFVNVPASVAATLASDTLAVGDTNLAQAVTPNRPGCEPAYPDARTCIAPGRPLTVPCAITDQRNFTVLAPDPRGLDADQDGIGCEPIAPTGGTVARDASMDLASSASAMRRAAPAGGVAVAASRVRPDAGAWGSPAASRRADTLVVHRTWGGAGLWYAAPTRLGTGNVAVVRNPTPTFIANGVWCWPDRFSRDDWLWQQRHPGRDGVRFLPSTVYVNNLAGAVTGSGAGNVAIVSNPIFISNGVWAWPDHSRGDDWSWRNRPGHGGWFWPNRFNLGHVTVASSGTGNIAIVSNPVFIGRGVWHWPGHLNAGGWPGIVRAGNLAVARSGDNIAIVSNSVVIIAGGLWYVPPARNHDHDHNWYDHRDDDDHRDHDDGDHRDDVDHHDRDDADVHLMQGASAQAERPDDAVQEIDDDGASEAPPSEITPLAASTQPTLTVNGGLAVEPAPADSTEAPGSTAVETPTEVDQAASDGDAALPSEGTMGSPGDGAVAAPLDSAAQPPPAADAPPAIDVAPDPVYVAPDPGYVAPDPVYVAPDPVYVAPDPVYVAPDPGYVAPDPGYVAPVYAEPAYAEPAYAEPAYAEPAYAEPAYVEPTYVEPQTSFVDPGFAVNDVAPQPAAVLPEPVNMAPEPSFVAAGNGAATPGLDAGYVDAGNGQAGAGNMAPDPGPNEAGNVDPGAGAAEFGDGGGGGDGG